MGRRRPGGGILGTAGGTSASARKSRQAFRTKSMVNPGTRTFAPAASWTKGDRDITGAAGTMKKGSHLFHEKGAGEGEWGYQEGGDVYGKGIAKMEADLEYFDPALGEYVTGHGQGGYGGDTGLGSAPGGFFGSTQAMEAGEFGGAVRGPFDAGYVGRAWETAVNRPHETWLKGEIGESGYHYGMKQGGMAQSILDELPETSRQYLSDSLYMPSEFVGEQAYEQATSTAKEAQEGALQQIRDIWITSAAAEGDDELVKKRDELLGTLSEYGLTEDDILTDLEGTMLGEGQFGARHEAIEETWEQAQEKRELQGQLAARERIKANLAGEGQVAGAQARLGASGLAYSGAQQRALENVKEGARADLRTISKGEKLGIDSLVEASEARGQAYTDLLDEAIGTGGALPSYEEARGDYETAQEGFLNTAVIQLEKYNKELEDLTTYGPSAVIGKQNRPGTAKLASRLQERMLVPTVVSEWSEHATPAERGKTSLQAADKAYRAMTQKTITGD
tara:strand:- start:6156 stop:7676 length:1521 start_codon:yes stop_codon:yes gene_type:complete